MGALYPPGPSVAKGVKLLSFQPSVPSCRNSKPVLKECGPWIQLNVSAHVTSGLHDPRVEPKPALKLLKPWVRVTGTPCIGIPLYCGNSLNASLPLSVEASPLSRSRPTYHGAHCAMSWPRYPQRASLTLLPIVETKD